jgi:hypothetical protein
MAIKALRFQDLLPERDVFELADGTKIPFRSRLEFDARDANRLQTILKEAQQASTRFAAKPTDEKAARQVDGAIDAIVRFILPDIPDDVLDILKTEQKSEILSWWTERGKAGPGEAAADQPVGA